MSSAPAPKHSTSPPPHPADPQPGDTGRKATDRVVVYRHSHLFYWWPVWLLGFIFAGITYFDNQHLAIVPTGTEAVERNVDVDGKGTMEERNVLILGKGKQHRLHKSEDGVEETVQPTIYVTRWRELGSVYAIVLLIVIFITNIAVRGLWTVLAMVLFIMLTLILAAGGWWGGIFHKLNQLSIYINMGGYLLISIVLFILWLVNFVFFDRQTYMIFTPGQLRVRLEIGGEETVYDTASMVVTKQRSDMFRHWILGFGSGDLIVRPAGLAHPLEFDNVLNVGYVLARIETMVKEKVIVRPGTTTA